MDGLQLALSLIPTVIQAQQAFNEARAALSETDQAKVDEAYRQATAERNAIADQLSLIPPDQE